MSDTNIQDEMGEESKFNLCKGMGCLNMNPNPFNFSPTPSEASVEVPQDKYGVWYKQLCELQDLGLDKIALVTSSKDVRRLYKTKFRNLCQSHGPCAKNLKNQNKTPKIEDKHFDPNFEECHCLDESPSSPRYNSPRSSESSSFVDCNCPQNSPQAE